MLSTERSKSRDLDEGAAMDEAMCPSEQVLSRFVLGKLSEAEFGVVARHVERCPRCDAVAENLEQVPDGLLRRLRRVERRDEYLGEPELWGAVLHVIRLNQCEAGRANSKARPKVQARAV